MMKSILAAGAALSLIAVAACSQGPNEEAGEAADTAAEQAATGTTDLGQGPQEEAGEALDAQTDSTTTAPDGDTTTTTPPATTP